jgi:para-nitrobenzyl esterase
MKKSGMLIGHIALVLIIPLTRQTTFAKSPDEATIVQVDGGKVRGVAENGLLVFKGIPYAAPPVGEPASKQFRSLR